MGNSLRCCLACVLPCGALDLIRIVHLNGYVEEITRPITAGEVLKANPNHVLSKPSSQGVVRRILILSPETELKRGSIYFLIPESSLPENKRHAGKGSIGGDSGIKKKASTMKSNKGSSDVDYSSLPQGYLKVTHKGSKEKRSSCRDRRKGRIGIWRPHLESILED
ncbi:hypothetical protein AAZX31_18G056300 [Glycine max]|uniref:DUF4228 domain-containing protein n=1 Tax=Glycine max TaxID=3847 RepID=C6SYD4_SOYBN|nr:uncharacterized protein LOC100306192 [Glycine max]ACU14257.1 unknown [Glycine max]KAG4920522.1 hypothetical protein JHK86_049335 [Glycine max]KAG4935181.1 hypothetical protein JHK85_050100 [Glycine max]KAG5090699.1 hypothetical protein JHK82_049477 [Glycine max]KAG5093787.1 hypothetical protein JHK84_049375 [Glycine max]|eukprot:NP_001235196.1 uncharacterized protein LOC100306192 [Glycine max]